MELELQKCAKYGMAPVEASAASLARRRSERFVVTGIDLRSGVPSRVGVG
ncbi:hypothetical protein [Actinomadura sp. KC06]|nr:hypothetical protein [Actinomadura sp. KC06]